MQPTISEHIHKCINLLQGILERQICPMAVCMHGYKGSMPRYFPLRRAKEANQTSVGSHHHICTMSAKPNEEAHPNLQGKSGLLKCRLVGSQN